MSLKLVIDTDVGSDDAIALILCVAAETRGQAQILGITCCHGNTKLSNVCANTLKVLHTLNRLDIPVFKGAKHALNQTMVDLPSHVHGTDGFGDFDYPHAPCKKHMLQKMHAVNYLTSIMAAHPGEITLLTLGPLTNVALAIRMDPTFANNVKRIVIMGGNSEAVGNTTAAAEFNFYCDPDAAHITIHNMKCPITIFPWETSLRHTNIPYTWRKGVLGACQSPQARLMNKVERFMLESEMHDTWPPCDPMAAAVLLRPEIITRQAEYYVTVELHGEATRGAMVIDYHEMMDKEPNVTLVERIDVEKFKSLLMEAFTMDMSAPVSQLRFADCGYCRVRGGTVGWLPLLSPHRLSMQGQRQASRRSRISHGSRQQSRPACCVQQGPADH